MTDKRIIEYKNNLKSPYTGMTQDIYDKIIGPETPLKKTKHNKKVK